MPTGVTTDQGVRRRYLRAATLVFPSPIQVDVLRGHPDTPMLGSLSTPGVGIGVLRTMRRSASDQLLEPLNQARQWEGVHLGDVRRGVVPHDLVALLGPQTRLRG